MYTKMFFAIYLSRPHSLLNVHVRIAFKVLKKVMVCYVYVLLVLKYRTYKYIFKDRFFKVDNFSKFFTPLPFICFLQVSKKTPLH